MGPAAAGRGALRSPASAAAATSWLSKRIVAASREQRIFNVW